MNRVAVVGSTVNRTSWRLVAEWRSAGVDAALLSAAEAKDLLDAGDVAVGRLCPHADAICAWSWRAGRWWARSSGQRRRASGGRTCRSAGRSRP